MPDTPAQVSESPSEGASLAAQEALQGQSASAEVGAATPEVDAPPAPARITPRLAERKVVSVQYFVQHFSKRQELLVQPAIGGGLLRAGEWAGLQGGFSVWAAQP